MREDRDLNQTEIAKYLGVRQTAYSKYELGQRSMTPEVLVKLANFHNTSVDYLLGCRGVTISSTRKKMFTLHLNDEV